MKPKIKGLQNFAKQYFKNRCPIVKWKKMKYCGLADIKENIIYLNPGDRILTFGCRVGEGFYKPGVKIRLRPGEQYFVTLLHEIAEIKFFGKSKAPKHFYSIKNGVLKELKESKVKPTLDNIAYWAKEHFKSDWQRLQFRSWLGQRLMSEHIKVEEWAIKEFEKQREKIKKILSQQT